MVPVSVADWVIAATSKEISSGLCREGANLMLAYFGGVNRKTTNLSWPKITPTDPTSLVSISLSFVSSRVSIWTGRRLSRGLPSEVDTPSALSRRA
jgi:hypothetical protein